MKRRKEEWKRNIANQPLVSGSLPIGLQELYLSTSYNHPITSGILPPSLRILLLSQSYRHDIGSGILPSGLTDLWFFPPDASEDDMSKCHFSNRLVFPRSLIRLRLAVNFNRITDRLQTRYSNILPDSLQFFHFRGDPVCVWNSLPRNLKELSIIGRTNSYPLDNHLVNRLSLDRLPPSLTSFSISDHCILEGMFPASLINIHLDALVGLIKPHFPPSAQTIRINYSEDAQKYSKQFPESLISYSRTTINNNNNNVEEVVSTSSIRSLRFSSHVPISYYLPFLHTLPSLTYLDLDGFAVEIKRGLLPISLIALFGLNCTTPILSGILPPFLQQMEFYRSKKRTINNADDNDNESDDNDIDDDSEDSTSDDNRCRYSCPYPFSFECGVISELPLREFRLPPLYNSPLTSGVFPCTLLHLHMMDENILYHGSLPVGLFGEGLLSLSLYASSPLSATLFPLSLRSLRIGGPCQSSLMDEGVIPSNLSELITIARPQDPIDAQQKWKFLFHPSRLPSSIRVLALSKYWKYDRETVTPSRSRDASSSSSAPESDTTVLGEGWVEGLLELYIEDGSSFPLFSYASLLPRSLCVLSLCGVTIHLESSMKNEDRNHDHHCQNTGCDAFHQRDFLRFVSESVDENDQERRSDPSSQQTGFSITLSQHCLDALPLGLILCGDSTHSANCCIGQVRNSILK